MKFSQFIQLFKYTLATYVVVKLMSQMDAVVVAILKNSEVLDKLYQLFAHSRFFR